MTGAGRGLATRLFVGLTIVLLAGALTAALVAALIGPAIFHDHLLQAGHQENSAELAHIELAYRDASLISVGVGLFTAGLAAIAVTWYLTRLLRRPLTDLTTAARDLAGGHYATRVPDTGSGTELDTLAVAFNTMADRLEGIEDTRRRMLADLAHELRTPIAALAAYHEGLHDHVVELGPESQAALADQTARLARLADDIDEVSTAEEGRLQLRVGTHDVADLFHSVSEAVHDRYTDAGVELVVDVDDTAGITVRGDRERLAQVLTNLLTNALRHTPAGGTTTLSAVPVSDGIALHVVDTGDGITAEQLPHIFERFYRGDTARARDRRGSGIGLTISRAVVEAHGGTIEATSDGPGRGTHVVVRLPATG